MANPLEFVCPVCGARPNELCKSTAGGPCEMSHVERLLVAEDSINKKQDKKAKWADRVLA
jgi:hypothetical protein